MYQAVNMLISAGLTAASAGRHRNCRFYFSAVWKKVQVNLFTKRAHEPCKPETRKCLVFLLFCHF